MADLVASYIPSDVYVKRFWEKEAVREKTSLDVPDGFPRHIDSPLVWTAKEVEAKESQWTLDLTVEEIAAIDAALATFEGRSFTDPASSIVVVILLLANHDNLSELSSTTFDLPPAFFRRLRKLSDQIYSSVGFQLIRGLDPSKYTPRQYLIIYAGMSSHICP